MGGNTIGHVKKDETTEVACETEWEAGEDQARKSPPKASSKEAKAGLRMPTPKKRAPSTKVQAKKPESKTGRRRDAPIVRDDHQTDRELSVPSGRG
jgi:hypothetical protein